MKQTILFISLLSCLWGSVQGQQLIQATLKPGAGNSLEVWLKPNFTNTTKYLFQIGLPIAFPASASPAPTGLSWTLHPDFVASLGIGNSYTVTVNPVATAAGGTEKYFNIVLVRGGASGSIPQYWKQDSAFAVLSFTFLPNTAPAAQVKLADYQDGGSDGQGNFYTQSGVGDYYVSSNLAENFYSTPGFATAGGLPTAGYVQTNSPVPSVCTPPAPTVGSIGTTTATVSWPATGATGYEYDVSTNNTPPASGTATTATTYPASGLTASTTYYAHVRSSCAGGSFSPWATTSFTTQNPGCTAPDAATVTNLTTTTASLQWTTVTGAAGYEYTFSTGNTPPASGTPTTNLTATDNTLAPGTAYFLHLRTACAGGFFSSWVSTPFTTLCPGPALPVVSGVTADGATFTWPVVTGAVSYQYDLTESPTPPLTGASTTATSYTASALSGGTTYYFHVRTVCAAAGSVSSWSTVPVTTVCPGLTATPTVGTVTAATAQVLWAPVPGVTEFEYVLSTSATQPTGAGQDAASPLSLTGLTPGTTYYVFVRAACPSGTFSAWSSVSFSTLGQSCGPPSPPVIGTLTGQVASFSWTLGSGATGSQYAVTTSATPPAGDGTPAPAGVLTATVGSLLVNTTYYAHVRAVCGGSNFSNWSTSSFKTRCSNPNTPIVQESSITTTTTTLTINAPAGAAGYEYVVSTSNTPPTGTTGGTPGTASMLNLTGLTGGTRYYVHVRTACSGGLFSDGWVTASWVTPCVKPVVSATVESFTANLVWAAISGARRYEQALTTTLTPPMAGAPTGDTTMQFPHLTEGSGYFFHVRTYCLSGLYSSWTTVNFQTPGLNAYPNPVRGSLRVNLYGAEPATNGELRLYDAVGKLVKVQTMTSASTTLNLQALAAGMYLLKYSDGRIKHTTKIMKQ